jgi:hypothetical protein
MYTDKFECILIILLKNIDHFYYDNQMKMQCVLGNIGFIMAYKSDQ